MKGPASNSRGGQSVLVYVWAKTVHFSRLVLSATL
uniref:Uncharacterized protein n=1 Tax=Anguilla anguilla TaxID=7936 RepID=A0A0E9RGQ0_ANGAN